LIDNAKPDLGRRYALPQAVEYKPVGLNGPADTSKTPFAMLFVYSACRRTGSWQKALAVDVAVNTSVLSVVKTKPLRRPNAWASGVDHIRQFRPDFFAADAD